jgi:hypothetical protein
MCFFIGKDLIFQYYSHEFPASHISVYRRKTSLRNFLTSDVSTPAELSLTDMTIAPLTSQLPHLVFTLKYLLELERNITNFYQTHCGQSYLVFKRPSGGDC